MKDKSKDTKVKAIRSGIEITTDDDELVPNTAIVDAIKKLLKEAEDGLIQEIAFSTCGENNSLAIMGYSRQMGHQLRGLNMIYEEHAYLDMWEVLYVDE